MLRSPEIDIGGAADVVGSLPGEFSVPAAVAVLDVVYASGSGAMDRASNPSDVTMPARAIVTAKPSSTTATVVYLGRVEGFVGLTPGEEYFVGVLGGIVLASGLPTAPGSVAQRIGTALSPTALLFEPGEIVIL